MFSCIKNLPLSGMAHHCPSALRPITLTRSPREFADESADEERPTSPNTSPAAELPSGRATRPRRLSVLKRGWLTLLAHLIRYGELRIGRFWPEPWPRLPFVRQFLEPFWRGGHVFLY